MNKTNIKKWVAITAAVIAVVAMAMAMAMATSDINYDDSNDDIPVDDLIIAGEIQDTVSKK